MRMLFYGSMKNEQCCFESVLLKVKSALVDYFYCKEAVVYAVFYSIIAPKNTEVGLGATRSLYPEAQPTRWFPRLLCEAPCCLLFLFLHYFQCFWILDTTTT